MNRRIEEDEGLGVESRYIVSSCEESSEEEEEMLEEEGCEEGDLRLGNGGDCEKKDSRRTSDASRRVSQNDGPISDTEAQLEDNEDLNEGTFVSLFDDYEAKSAKKLFIYMKCKFGFDIGKFLTLPWFDEYAYIRLINFIRSSNQNPKVDWEELYSTENSLWRDDAFLSQGNLGEDRLLFESGIDWDLLEAERAMAEARASNLSVGKEDATVGSDGGNWAVGTSAETCMSFDELYALQYNLRRCKLDSQGVEAEKEGEEKNGEKIEKNAEKMEKNDEKIKKIAERSSKEIGTTGPENKNDLTDEADDALWIQDRRRNCNVCSNEESPYNPSAPNNQSDTWYFNGYNYLDIHREMIGDKVRTKTYHDFITSNAACFKGKIVLDVGCGTGILSLFAAKAGAKQVIGVEAARDTAHFARRLVEQNGFSKVVKIVSGKIEDLSLTEFASNGEEFRCDIIVSEWMGYCLFYEQMLASVIFARDSFLKPGGLMVPNFVVMGMVSGECVSESEGGLDGGDYGLDLSLLVERRNSRMAEISVIGAECINGVPSPFMLLDLNKVNTSSLGEIRFKFSYVCSNPSNVLVLYFDTLFALPPANSLSTGKLSGEKNEHKFTSLSVPNSNIHVSTIIPTNPECIAYHTGGVHMLKINPTNRTIQPTPFSHFYHILKHNFQHTLTHVLRTDPLSPHTHWKQTLLHLQDTESDRHMTIRGMPNGEDELKGWVTFSPGCDNQRLLSIVLRLDMFVMARSEAEKLRGDKSEETSEARTIREMSRQYSSHSCLDYEDESWSTRKTYTKYYDLM